MNRPANILAATMTAFALLLLPMQTAVADEPESAETVTNPAIEADAQAVLDRMTASLSALKSFSITSDSSRDEVMDLGYKLQNNEHAVMVASRPDKLRVEVDGDLRDRTFVFDGAKLTMYSPDDAAYTQIKAPGTLEDLVGGLLDAGVEMPLIDVLYQGLAGTLTDNVASGILVGDSTINGIACDQLAFRQAYIDWQLWVQKGANALPLKIVITTRYDVGAPQFQSVLSWNLKPAIDKATFAFTPPKDALEVSFSDPDSFNAPDNKGDK